MGVSKQIDSAVGMGAAVTFVMTIASIVTWILYAYFLSPTESSIFFLLFNTPVDRIPDLTFFAHHCLYFGNRFAGAVY